MALYRLSPNVEKMEHRDWAASTFFGSCVVSAASAEKARDYATAAFVIATRRDGGPLRFCPWTQEGLVACILVGSEESVMPPEGLVMLPADSGRPDFMAVGPNRGEVWPPQWLKN